MSIFSIVVYPTLNLLLIPNVTTIEGDSDDMSPQSDEEEHENEALEELKRKQHHPYRLHAELWYNEKGEVSFF